eukprot:1102223-Pyramimonas_sp.AAC.1
MESQWDLRDGALDSRPVNVVNLEAPDRSGQAHGKLLYKQAAAIPLAPSWELEPWGPWEL